MKRKLNLGCGEERMGGYVNVDINELAKPDIIHDLNSIPYPFKDNEFDEVYCSHVLEHLREPFKVMKEMHRILKDSGILILKVPHFSRGFTNTDHKCGFDAGFPMYFNSGFTRSGYFGVDFELKRIRLRWMQSPKLLRRVGVGTITVWVASVAGAVFDFFANLSPYFCSRIWCFYVGGFEEIEFVFVCSKPKRKEAVRR